MGLLDWSDEDYIAVKCEEALEEGMERGRQYFMGLLNQGLSTDEIRERLEVGLGNRE